MGGDQQIIWLHRQAPIKPALGLACNGCGVCCAASPCPVARVFLWRWRGACSALEWHAELKQYRCGMLLRPSHYLFLLPHLVSPWFAGRIRRWIAADVACDSEVDSEVDSGV